MAMGRITDTLGLVRELNGRLHLVAGNHDRCWPVDPIPGISAKHVRKAAEWADRYRDVGFATITQDTGMTSAATAPPSDSTTSHTQATPTTPRCGRPPPLVRGPPTGAMWPTEVNA